MKLEHSSWNFLKLDYFDFFLLFDFQEIMSRRKQKTEKERQEKARLNLLSVFFERIFFRQQKLHIQVKTHRLPNRHRLRKPGEKSENSLFFHFFGKPEFFDKISTSNFPELFFIFLIKFMKKINLIFNS